MRRAQQQIITFPVYDSTTGARKTGLSFSAGELQWSKDGVNFVNVSGTPAEILLSDGSPSGVYSLSLSVSESSTGWGHLLGNKTSCRPIDVFGGFDSQPIATVVSNGGNTASTFATSLTSAQNDNHKNKLLRFETGVLAGQIQKISAYNGATKMPSFASPFSATPSAGDIFTLIDD